MGEYATCEALAARGSGMRMPGTLPGGTGLASYFADCCSFALEGAYLRCLKAR